jgi:hypothetical protein
MKLLTSFATTCIGLLAVLSPASHARFVRHSDTIFTVPKTANTTGNATTTLVQGHYFNRVIIIMLENKDFIAAVKQPYFASLGKRGRVLTQYAGITHPSQPNYIGTIFGSLEGTNMSFDVE